jgi:predicted metalloprotease
MEWEGRAESENVEDRRRFGKTGLVVGGGIGSIVLVILALVTGVDPRQFMGQGGQGDGGGQPDPAEERLAHFTKVIFRDTEDVWDDLFRKMGKTYQKPELVLFSGQVQSACGFADAAVGPFYCPGDAHVYIDLSFYRDMEKKLDAGGEFARAYVVAHEVGHHVQKLLGYAERADRVRRRSDRLEHEMSVRLELQADYLAGVWAHHGQERWKFLQPGDLKSALNAAFQIGDDTLQRKARGTVVPEKFTHGRSDQRTKWFKRGFDTGDVEAASQLFELDYGDL